MNAVLFMIKVMAFLPKIALILFIIWLGKWIYNTIFTKEL